MKKIIFSSLIVCATLAFMFSTNFSTESLHNSLEGVLYDTAIAAHIDNEVEITKWCEEHETSYIECKASSTDCTPTSCKSDTDYS